MDIKSSPTRLSARLKELLSKESGYANVVLVDGTSLEIKPETNGNVEVGFDYVLLQKQMETGDPAPPAPSLYPFSAIKAIHFVD